MAETHESPMARGKRMLKESGYHPDEAEDKALVKAMVKPKALKRRKHGGGIEGEEPESRPDKRARGGKVGGKTTVNVIAGKSGDDPMKLQQAHQMGMQQGMKAGAAMAAQKLAGGMHPGGAPMGPGGPPGIAAPPGAGMGPPPPGPPMAARGGRLPRAKGGSVEDDSGEPPISLRSEKFSGADSHHMPPFPKEDEPIRVKSHTRRRSGGGVECE